MLETHRIPVSEAIRKTSNWRKYNQLHNPEDSGYIRAFRIPLEDIHRLAEVTNAVAYRAYVAMEDDLSPSSAKLVLVAIVEDQVLQKECDLVSDDTGSRVYDFTTPCPDSCDFDSVLYRGTQEGSL